jgi:hypothetical protein
MYGVTMSILSRFPTPHHQAQQNFNKQLGSALHHSACPGALAANFLQVGQDSKA